MLAVGRSRLAASGGQTVSKLHAILTKAAVRSTPLTAGGPTNLAPFVKANLPLLASIVLRNYATTTKKTAAKKPATKTTAVKKTTVKKTAVKKPAVKKTTTTKKPAAKSRTVAKKGGTRRAATKKKPVKKKATKKKKEVEKKPGLITTLRLALRDEPSTRVNSYALFYSDLIKEKPKDTPITEYAKVIGARWHALPEEEKKNYRDRADVERAARRAAHDKWLAQQNPADIMAANIARRKVNEIRKSRTRSKHGSTVIAPLKDPRIVKLPKNAWLYFIEENRNLPPYADISKATDRIKEMSKAYRSLSESQKKKYHDMQVQDQARYTIEKAEFEKKFKK